MRLRCLLPYADDVAQLGRTEFRWPQPEGPHLVSAVWAEVDGRPACVSLEITGVDGAQVAIGAQVLRDLGPELARRGRGHAEWVEKVASKVDVEVERRRHQELLALVRSEDRRSRPGPDPRRNLEHYGAVALLYARAHAEGRPPTQAVADHFDVPRSTAASWVGRARTLGLLDPARPSVAGGVPAGRRERKRP